MTTDDRTLIGRILGGETEEFRHLMRRHGGALLGFIEGVVGSREEAEDVVQEVLMRLWMREMGREKMSEEDTMEREQTRSETSREVLAALAIKATKNQCVSTWRKQKLRQGVPIDDGLASISSDERADKPLLMTEQANAIDIAIQRLPRSERRLILLKQTADLSSDEIALLTGIPIRSVRTMLSSARRNLLKLLKQ